MNQRELVAKALRDDWCGSPWVDRDPWESIGASSQRVWLDLADTAIGAYLQVPASEQVA